MKKILLPTDFSENAYNAIRYAVQLFKNKDCIFYLLNTYTPVLYDSDYLLYSPASALSLDEIYRQNSKGQLENIKKRVKTEFPSERHTFELISSFSLLNEEIKDQVKEKNIDMVIMGTQGATGAAQILFGTHTVHAIKRATCPLIAVPSNYRFTPLKNILFPTDYEINYSQAHLEILNEFALSNKANIHILHVLFGKKLGEEQQKAQHILSGYLENASFTFHTIEKNTVSEGIYTFQAQQECELLVMISNKHSFFENLLFRPVINEIGFQVKVPFLVIPSGKKNT